MSQRSLPSRTREALEERHAKIVELWQEEVPIACHECGQQTSRRRTLKEIALAVGLRHGWTAYRHINGECACNGMRSEPCQKVKA